MWLLFADLAALSSAPALDGLTRARPGWHRFLTELSRVGVAGIVLLDLVPHAWQSLGPLALLLFVGGAAAVVGAERWLARVAEGVVGPVALLALGAHHVADGIALGVGERALAAAVVLHAVPVALVAWRIGMERGGARLGWATIAWIAIATLVGYAVGSIGLGAAAGQVSEGVACALGGGLLHALLHLHAEEGHSTSGALGVATALGLLALLLSADPDPGIEAMPPLMVLALAGAAALAVVTSRHAHRVGVEPR